VPAAVWAAANCQHLLSWGWSQRKAHSRRRIAANPAQHPRAPHVPLLTRRSRKRERGNDGERPRRRVVDVFQSGMRGVDVNELRPSGIVQGLMIAGSLCLRRAKGTNFSAGEQGMAWRGLARGPSHTITQSRTQSRTQSHKSSCNHAVVRITQSCGHTILQSCKSHDHAIV
jgi:hypothetical protein